MIGVVVWSGEDTAVIWCQDASGFAYLNCRSEWCGRSWMNPGDLVEFEMSSHAGVSLARRVCPVSEEGLEAKCSTPQRPNLKVARAAG